MNEKSNRFSFLNIIEKLGNLLPHPAMIFVWLIGIIFIGSFVASYFGLSVIDPRDSSKEIAVINLLSMKEFVRFSTSLVDNFTNFPPLGTVLIAMLGISIAEASGMLSTLIRAAVINAPKKLVTLIVVIAGILSNIASDVGYVVLIPLAGIIFHSLGRNPISRNCCCFCRRFRWL